MIQSILLVDDDADDTELFSEALHDIAPSILLFYAKDGIDALEKLDKMQELPELIFLDINMPRMNGWECLGKLKSSDQYQKIPVIMYSTSSIKKEMEIATSLGAINFISKPDNFTSLKNVLMVATGVK
ncbi:MAG: rcp1 3 [Bacteroidetes bacterium]|nr:rcp1 3 [Bacteroidota bacterium]